MCCKILAPTADEFRGGTILYPKDGETYSSRSWVKEDILGMRGFVGISLLG